MNATLEIELNNLFWNYSNDTVFLLGIELIDSLYWQLHWNLNVVLDYDLRVALRAT